MSNSGTRQSSTFSPDHYRAFISYRHLDNQQQGRQWATWLHHSLEKYEVPEDLIGVKNELGITIPEVIYPIFRDEEELPADANLTRSILSALDRSSYLIVLCSPRSVASQYVCDEIVYFKKIGRSDRILSVMIEGEPNASWDVGKHKVGFKPDQECLPLPLRHPVNAQGEIDTKRHAEPIAADLRLMPGGQQGWTTHAAYREALLAEKNYSSKEIKRKVDAYQLVLQRGLQKILAGVMGVSLGTLTQRDRAYQLEKERRKAKLLRRWLTATTILGIVAVISGLVAWIQRGVALKNEDIANEKTAQVEKEKEKVVISERATREQLAIAENNLGLTFASNAQRALENQQYNSAYLYALRALSKLNATTEETARAQMAGLTVSQPVFLPIMQLAHAAEPSVNVLSVAYSPDGQTVASGASDKIIRIWDARTGKQRVALEGHEGDVLSLAYSPDGRTLVSGSEDRSIRLWDVERGQQLATLVGHNDDVRIEKEAILAGDPGQVSSVAFSPDGRLIVSGAWGGTIRLWDVEIRRSKAVLQGHSKDVNSVAISPDGRTVASGSWDGTIRLWDVASGSQKGVWDGETGVITSVAFSPDGRTVVSGSYDRTVRLWDVKTGKQQAVLDKHTDVVRTVVFSADGRSIASGGEDRTIRLWDVETRKQKAVLEGHLEAVSGVVFAPDRRTVVSGSRDRTVRIWNLANDTEGSRLQSHTVPVNCVAFSADGQSIVSGGADYAVRLWDAASRQPTAVLNGHTESVNCVAFSPDGRTIASGAWLSPTFLAQMPVSDDPDFYVHLWDAQTGQEITRLLGHERGVKSVAFSPDGRTVASGSYDRTVRLWDMDSGTQIDISNEHEGSVNCVAFSRDGQTIASASDDMTIRLWNATTTGEIVVLEGHTGSVESVAFSSDGRTIASAAGDDTVRLWDSATRKQKSLLQVSAQCLAISPDGRTIATGSSDETVRIWDTENGELQAVLKGHTSMVNSVAFSPDGQTLISGGLNDAIRIWFLKPDCNRVPTELELDGFEDAYWLKLQKMEMVPAEIQEPSLALVSPHWPVDHPFHWIDVAESGDTNAMVQLGLCYDRNNETEKALVWYQKAADAGDEYGTFRLASLKNRLRDQIGDRTGDVQAGLQPRELNLIILAIRFLLFIF